MSYRRLSEDLLEVENRLQRWAPWARPHYSNGWPNMCSIERARSGRGSHYEGEWPRDVVEAERAVARLPVPLLAAVFAQYFYMTQVAEVRVVIYGRLICKLLRLRCKSFISKEKIGARSFKRDLSRARWALKNELKV
jgi:hypothetical protein